MSMQLPFAVIPLIRFTNDKRRMGEFANRGMGEGAGVGAAALILGLNLWLVWQQMGDWGHGHPWGVAATAPLLAGVLALLGWITFAGERRAAAPAEAEAGTTAGMVTANRVTADRITASLITANLRAPVYRRILVPLDHSSRDRAAIAHAAYLGRLHGAVLHLVHVKRARPAGCLGRWRRTPRCTRARSISAGSWIR